MKTGNYVWVLIRPDLLNGPLTHVFKTKIETVKKAAPKITVEAIEEDDDAWDECETMGLNGGPCD